MPVAIRPGLAPVAAVHATWFDSIDIYRAGQLHQKERDLAAQFELRVVPAFCRRFVSSNISKHLALGPHHFYAGHFLTAIYMTCGFFASAHGVCHFAYTTLRYYSPHAVFGVRQHIKRIDRIHRSWRSATIPAPNSK